MSKQQKISNISLGIVAVVTMIGMFFLPSIILSANAQNATITNSMDIESVKTHLEQAIDALNNGNIQVANQHVELAEDQLETMLEDDDDEFGDD
jgi:exonuclease VII small subunit